MPISRHHEAPVGKPLLSPPRLLALGYLAIIAVGGVLLHAPFATTEPISWLDAYFTAVSATTVTGLVVVDTGITFTLAGQVVLLLLMQVGGLGLMTFAVLTAVLLGKRIGLRQRLVVGQSFNTSTIGGARQLVATILVFALAVELVGMALLAVWTVPSMGLFEGLWFSLFHAVSAFNNAGFSTRSDSLMEFAGDPVVTLVVSAMFILGGIGFVVVADVVRRRSFRRLSLHSRLMIAGTVVVNLVAMAVLMALEWNNPATLGGLDTGDRLLAGWFQAVTPRTAGFNTLDIGQMTDSSLLVMMVLMFVGAGSASTGSGIKLTTFLLILLATAAFLRGRATPEAFGRSVAQATVVKALAITVVAAMFVFFAVLVLTVVAPHDFEPLAFEAVSAFGTVGLSTGITAEMGTAGKLVLMMMMFIGRVGPLTLAFTLAAPARARVRYPEDEVLTG